MDINVSIYVDLQPEETQLVGYWLDLGSSVEKDAVWERIEWLIKSKLELRAHHSSGTETLYRDPADGRFWELSRRASQLRDGGPPSLKVIDPEQAAQKYNLQDERK